MIWTVLIRIVHPLSHVLTHSLLENTPESVVTSEATFDCQLLGCVGSMCSDSIMIETYKKIDAQIVDIIIVSRALIGEILAKI